MSRAARVTAALVGVVFTLGGCGRGAGVAEADTCEAIADEHVVIVNDIIADDGDRSMEEAVADAGDAMPSEGPFTWSEEHQARLDALAPRATAAGCSPEDLAPLMKERADQIEGDGFIAELIRGMFERGGAPEVVPTGDAGD